MCACNRLAAQLRRLYFLWRKSNLKDCKCNNESAQDRYQATGYNKGNSLPIAHGANVEPYCTANFPIGTRPPHPRKSGRTPGSLLSNFIELLQRCIQVKAF